MKLRLMPQRNQKHKVASSEKRPIHSKLVYIHELDSVRNSSAEIEHARNRLYEEIMLNGNIPVISFNQLSDSKAFLGLVLDGDADDSNRGLRNMEYLMEAGRIRVARFGDKRTPSQYLQDNLAKRNGKTARDRFILSGWPIPSGLDECQIGSLHETIRLALRNSDPDYLDRHDGSDATRAKAGFGGHEAANPRLNGTAIKPLKQLVEFMLFISKAQLAYADISMGTKPQFEEILELLLDRIERGEIVGRSEDMLRQQDRRRQLADACKILRGVEKTIRNGLEPGGIKNRSTWHNMLKEAAESKGVDLTKRSTSACSSDFRLAFQIVDLCYNMTVEAGIDRCSLFLNPADENRFDSAIAVKLAEYQNSYEKYGHTYSDGSVKDPDSCAQGVYGRTASSRETAGNASFTDPDWDLAVDIQKALDNRFSEDGPGASVETYESGMPARRKKWRSNVYSALWFQTLGALVYVVLFSFIEVVLSLLDSFAENSIKLMVSADSPGVEELFSTNRTITVTLVFLVGVIAYAYMTRKNRHRDSKKVDPKIPLLGIAAIFFVVMPLLACVNVVPNADGAGLVPNFSLDDFLGNFISMLPSLVVGFIGVAVFAVIGSLLEESTGLPGLFESMRLVKRSVVDSGRFGRLARKHKSVKDAGLCDKRFDVEVIPNDAWGKLFEGNAPSCGSAKWRKYEALIEAHDGDAANDPALPIIMDEATVRCYEYAQGTEMGVVRDSPYNTLVVDLVRDGKGEEFAYERLIPKADSGVVVVPVHDGKFVLLRQFRHAIRERQWGFPRGFGEKGVKPEENACKELFEELGLEKKPDVSGMKPLGVLTPDSGISANKVAVFWCNVGDYAITKGNEGIEAVQEFTDAELRNAIADGDITDGFTLAAFTLWECRGE